MKRYRISGVWALVKAQVDKLSEEDKDELLRKLCEHLRYPYPSCLPARRTQERAAS